MRGPLDTSVFIAGEQDRPLATDRLPDEAAVSVVTLAELELGVHLATTEAVRGQPPSTARTATSTSWQSPSFASDLSLSSAC